MPALVVRGMMLGSLGLLLSVHIRQLKNFAGTMNFVIFPMYFISSVLLPLWSLRQSGADELHWLTLVNPFTHAVELMRHAAYGKSNGSRAGRGRGLWCGVLSGRGHRLRPAARLGPSRAAAGLRPPFAADADQPREL